MLCNHICNCREMLELEVIKIFTEQIFVVLFIVELFTITQNAVFQDNKYDGIRWNTHVVIYASEPIDWFLFWL